MLQLGYQVSQNVFPGNACVNNAGDPYVGTYYRVNSHEEERRLIKNFCRCFLDFTHTDLWGYCASGSTEAILHGLWTARKRFPPGTPVVASEHCHFCVPKIADMLCMPFVSVPEDQSIHDEVQKHPHAVVVLTLGSTIRNVYDPPVGSQKNVHVHLDGAFGGVITDLRAYQPFDSFNVSFHKFLGCPFPCALYLTRKELISSLQGVGCFGKDMVCLPNKDLTVSCSRNGTAVSMMNTLLNRPNFLAEHKMNVSTCFKNKDFLKTLLEHKGIKFRTDPEGLSVELFGVHTDPREYGLSVRNVRDNGSFDTHVFVMSHIDKTMLSEFVATLQISQS